MGYFDIKYLKTKYKKVFKRMLLVRLQNTKRFLNDYDDFKKVSEKINNRHLKLTRKQELYMFGIQAASAHIPILLFLTFLVIHFSFFHNYPMIGIVCFATISLMSLFLYDKNLNYAKLILYDIQNKIINLKKQKEKQYLGFKDIKISTSMLEKVLADEIKNFKK